MKKTLLALVLSMALVLSLAGCRKTATPENEAPTAEPQATADVQFTTEPEAQAAPSEAPAPTVETSRQDGERFESVIMIEGMEETVPYEHVVSKTAGFEMDYDYESFVRRSEAGREYFISVWDDPANPENYLEVTYDTGNAELVASAIRATLSSDYDLIEDTRTLDQGGEYLRIEASELKGTGRMADPLQVVYIIPAPDGCRVATAHLAIEAAEGFGRRFSYMINTLSVFERTTGGPLSDEQALSAVRNYCIISNPNLQEIVNAGDYPVYWDIASSDEQEIVVLFRSYTGALTRFYIDRSTGDAYTTEFVPGITPEEQRTDESINVWDYSA